MKNKKYIFIGIIILAVSFLAYCFYPVITYNANTSQHVTNFFNESEGPGRLLLYDRKGKIITDKRYKNGYYKWVKTDLNSEFVKSLLKIEDKNYYEHYGVNILSKLRALKDNLSGKRISGGSTITEQYIKNKYFKTQKRTYLQKLREAILALYFNMNRTKDNILNIYYHDVYFGNNLYGVGAAMEVYFKKDKLEELTKEEIVILISLIHNPSINSLEEKNFRKYFEKIKKRLGYKFDRTYFGKLNRKKQIDKFPFISELYSNSGDYDKFKDGIITSIDGELQDFTKEVIKNTLKELKNKNVTNAAVFAIIPKEPPSPLIRGNNREWEVLVYQGSKDFYATDIDGQVDVIKSKRQMGSSVKPFLYLMALQKGYGTDNLLIDLENEYNSFKNNKKYISENYSLKEYGLIRFKKALGNSLNNATVRLARELGLKEVYDFYKKYGFKLDKNPEYYGYSLVLGNPSITLENLVKSYSKLLDLEDKNKFLLYKILSNPDNRDISFGVNSILNTSVPMAVKTGTSSDFRDNIVISYHPDLIIGVWVGNNDNSSMKGVTGITGAGYIWHQIAEKAIELGYIKDREINIPKGIVESKYCLDKSCFRQELIYKKKGKKYFSRLADNFYSKRDILQNLSDYEKKKLGNLGFEIGK